MNDMKYFLVGMPSSGKSTIGKIVANQLGLRFIDLDAEIVAHEGTEITEIFQLKGEEYFRSLERKLLLKQIDMEEGFVLATGGGAPCFFDNMELMNASGVTIYLNVSIDKLFRKLSKKGTQKRPLLKNLADQDLYEELKNKLLERKSFYEQSHIIMDENIFDINERADQLIFSIKSLKK